MYNILCMTATINFYCDHRIRTSNDDKQRMNSGTEHCVTIRFAQIIVISPTAVQICSINHRHHPFDAIDLIACKWRVKPHFNIFILIIGYYYTRMNRNFNDEFK